MLQYLSVFMILRYEGGLSPAMAMVDRGVGGWCDVMTSGGENGGKQNLATVWRRTVSILLWRKWREKPAPPIITITFNSPPW